MKEAVVVSSVRTGLAKSYRGSFNQTRPDDLLSHVLDAAMKRDLNLVRTRNVTGEITHAPLHRRVKQWLIRKTFGKVM